MVKPSVTELLTKADNRYELVIATSRRARQIVERRLEIKNAKKNNAKLAEMNSNNLRMGTSSKSGYDPKEKEESAVTIAATEIAEGKVKIIEKRNETKEEDKK